MGTYMTLAVYGEPAADALALAEDKIGESESLWSVTYVNSDIYKVNHNGGISAEISGETAEVLAFDMAERTDGAFDPTVSPLHGDLSAENTTYRPRMI